MTKATWNSLSGWPIACWGLIAGSPKEDFDWNSEMDSSSV